MKNLLFIFVFGLLSFGAFAQIPSNHKVANDSLVFQKGSFLQNGKPLSRIKVTGIVMNNSEAYKYLKSAFNDLGVANFFASFGGVLIGWPLGTAIAGGKPMWVLAIAGGGIALISLPIYSSFRKKSARAVSVYNQGLSTRQITGMRLKLKFSGNGIGLLLKF